MKGGLTPGGGDFGIDSSLASLFFFFVYQYRIADPTCGGWCEAVLGIIYEQEQEQEMKCVKEVLWGP